MITALENIMYVNGGWLYTGILRKLHPLWMVDIIISCQMRPLRVMHNAMYPPSQLLSLPNTT